MNLNVVQIFDSGFSSFFIFVSKSSMCIDRPGEFNNFLQTRLLCFVGYDSYINTSRSVFGFMMKSMTPSNITDEEVR